MAGIVILYGKTEDGTIVPVDVDDLSRALVMMHSSEASAHDGNMFDYSAKLTIAAGASVYLLGRVGSLSPHWFNFNLHATNGPIEIRLFESPTVTNAGTVQTAVNRNRNSAKTSDLAVYAGATLSAEGSELFIDSVLASSTGVNSASSTETHPGEWILAPNTDYAIKLTNTAGSGDAIIYGSFTWYYH